MNNHQHDRQSHDLTQTLVIRLRAGETQAASLLEALYRDPIMRFCWGYLGNPTEAEDAVQEVFYKVLRSREVPDMFRPWVYRIARNHCLNVLRSRARRRTDAQMPVDNRLVDTLTGMLSRLADAEMRSRVMHLLAALPRDQREVLLLRYVEGLSRTETSLVLGIPVSAVKSRLFEGMRNLRQHTSILKSH